MAGQDLSRRCSLVARVLHSSASSDHTQTPLSPSPPLSVVMPVYNAQRYLPSAIESVLNQTFGDFELIVIDDGSTDSTPGMLHHYAAKDTRIRIISRPNTGQAVARDEGFRSARGVWLASMDSDDVCLPDRFKRQVEFLSANSDCVLVGCDVEEIDPEGYSLGIVRKPREHAEIEAAMLNGDGGAIHQSAAMMRRDALKHVGGYQARFPTTEDLDLFLRLAEIGRIANIPEVHFRYRVHFASQNRTRFQSQLQDIPRVVAEAMRRRGIPVPDSFSLPIGPPPGEAGQRRIWARRLRKQGNLRGALRQAAIAIWKKPGSIDSLKLIYQVLRNG